jgi:thymidine phosphorylase
MKREEDAAYLAQLMVETGALMGKKVIALLTDMDQPLGYAVGNALEVAECIDVMRGGGPADLRELSLEFCGWMFYLGERSASVAEGKQLAAELIANGKALAKFREVVCRQGGDPAAVDDPCLLPQAKFRAAVPSTWAGYVAQIECEQLGIASVMLGGGREKKEDAIDPAVGIVLHKKVGDAVTEGEPLATVYYNSPERLDAARAMLRDAYRVTNAARYVSRPLIGRVIGAD